MNDENGKPPWDIDERALAFGVRAVKLFRYLERRRDGASQVVGRQFLRAATSIGANLAEARSAETRADFVHKCAIALKETRESLYWLRLMAAAGIVEEQRLKGLVKETDELTAIITTINRKSKQRQ